MGMDLSKVSVFFSRLLLESLPFLAGRRLALSGIHPGHPCPDQLFVKDGPIYFDNTDGSFLSALCDRLHVNYLSEYHL
jgi:hypothetical protein